MPEGGAQRAERKGTRFLPSVLRPPRSVYNDPLAETSGSFAMSEQASSNESQPRRLIVRAVLRTDVGLVRSENQDFGALTTATEENHSNPGGRLMIVADGMGGHRGGATASRLAAETVKAQYLGSETTDIPTALRASLSRANARIYSEAQSTPELRGMGTTTSVLAVREGEGWLAHVGDSRIYMVRGDEIKQLTDDHSLVATMVREGLLTAQEAETHPRRNVLQRSMGVAEDVEIDVKGPFELQEGDTFILCSDGLHGVVKEEEIKEVVEAMPIDAAADEFLRRALARGAPDNVTVIVARVEIDDGLGPEPEKLEETQKLEAVDLYDETIRDTQPLEPVRDEEAPRPAPPKKNGLLKWAVVVVLLLGAAGAWFYWNHQFSFSSSPSSAR
jgi:serine/threonine protein phosphatase PrpC